jgi:hypothetical protein
MQLGQTFQEGISSGGFASAINGNNYIFDPFNVTPEVMVVKRKGALGITLAKQGIKTDASATATVQVPYDNNNLPIWLLEGASFTDPDGDIWWVSEAPKERRSGETFKQNIKCELRLV